MGSDVDVALCCGPQKKVAFTWEMIVCYGVPTVGRKRKVRGPHGGPEKENSPGRTDLVLPGFEVDLDVAQPIFFPFYGSNYMISLLNTDASKTSSYRRSVKEI
jgi:hypothetical protein